MSRQAPEWTVLITVAQSPEQPAISEEQSRAVLDVLGAEDAWIQYPPASGRGHGFETRWWQAGPDAGSVAIAGLERYRNAVAAVGIEVRVVLVHVASPADRLNETIVGLERRHGRPDVADPWNVMIRAIGDVSSGAGRPRVMLERLMALMPGADVSGYARDGLLEVRFWTDGVDAVDAAERGAQAFTTAMSRLDLPGWTIVRAHVQSVEEAHRTAYLGVARRLEDGGGSTLPVVIRT